jgi:hypothetical protein
MSFTSLSIVRAHLLTSDNDVLVVESLPIKLSGEDEINLPHDRIISGSETVKWDTTNLPSSDGPLVLSDYDKVQLSNGHVIRGSVVVTLGEALSTVYIEETDYSVDYLSGFIRRVPSGNIPDNAPVVAFYNCYTVFASPSDYVLDYDRGLIHRVSGSAIPDGATVLIDYTVEAGSITDTLIAQAIVEAEDLITRSLSTDYTAQSADQGLKTGATLLVLSFVARDMATEALARHPGSDAGGRAKEWQNLSALYEARAWQTLRPFLDRYPMHIPEKHANA